MCDSPFERYLRVEHPGSINFALEIIFTLLGTAESIAKGANTGCPPKNAPQAHTKENIISLPICRLEQK